MCFAILLLIGLIGLFVSANTATAQTPSRPEALRSGITGVPLNVRVLDRDGDPITNLKATDFLILEDGIPQTIAHFSIQTTALGFGGKVRSADSPLDAPPTEELDRVFLIVLGRGRLEGVAKGISGLIQFVRHQLRPGDRVAVLAYKRVTEYTTDRDIIIRFLERYRRDHQAIEAKLDHFFIDPEIRADIQTLFDSTELPGVRELSQPFPPTNIGQMYLGIEHLRAVQGEKHLVFISEDGINFGRHLTADLAAKAAADRIVVSPIQTAGTPLRLRQPSPGASGTSVRQSARTFAQAFAYSDLRNIARQTGGISSAYEYAEDTLKRIARATSFQYAMSYYPTNSAWDGTERKIEVIIKRSGATVQHRRSYTALNESAPRDPTLLLPRSRIAATGESPLEIRDIGIRVDVRNVTSSSSDKTARSDLHVTIFVDLSTLSFEQRTGERSAVLDVAVFCGDKDKHLVGEAWQHANVVLPDKTAHTPARNELEVNVRVPVEANPRYIKAVVYDRTTDKLGSVMLGLK